MLTSDRYLSSLNPAQRKAVLHGATSAEAEQALLIIAGAGSGKTNTLAHRVAHLIVSGADARRILLLTFTRRAAAEMTRRAHMLILDRSVAASGRTLASDRSVAASELTWSGTFHAVANRLLRLHGAGVALDPAFTVLDRSDAADLLNLLRNDLGLAKKSRRFPRKGTCLAIYSRAVNAQEPVENSLADHFPWCEEWAGELRKLFRAYVESKQKHRVLDYDDLLLYWYYLMQEEALAEQVRSRFDHVLVDEYQDTNALQASILLALRPTGAGLTVVGDDAQSIYSFRAASVRNILDFPNQFARRAAVVTLEQNYRSTQPILAAANAVISHAAERYSKALFSHQPSQQKPILATVADEQTQVDYVIEQVLANREAGVELRQQAVLFRTAHHSDALEVELSRRNIPYVKYGGLKFLEAAHVKDVLCFLRWAENPRDAVAGFRVLQLLEGIGPAAATRALEYLGDNHRSFEKLAEFQPPAAARELWPGLCATLDTLADPDTPWPSQLGLVRDFYRPILETTYDSAHVRDGDLEQLEHIAGDYHSRERFLSEITLDPPQGTGDLAGPPHLDEDYLILSTIHSAKGQEWDVVYTLNVADGCIPSDMSTGKPEQIEEERRLLYVAMTRAKTQLHLIHPLRFFIRQQHRHGDRHVYTPLSRFIPDDVLPCFERVVRGRDRASDELISADAPPIRVDVASKLREMW